MTMIDSAIRDDECCPTCGEPLDDAELQLEGYRADARALWAVRALDADGRRRREAPWAPYPNADGTFSMFALRGRFATEDAAREAMARVIVAAHPELDPDAPRGGS